MSWPETPHSLAYVLVLEICSVALIVRYMIISVWPRIGWSVWGLCLDKEAKRAAEIERKREVEKQRQHLLIQREKTASEQAATARRLADEAEDARKLAEEAESVRIIAEKAEAARRTVEEAETSRKVAEAAQKSAQAAKIFAEEARAAKKLAEEADVALKLVQQRRRLADEEAAAPRKACLISSSRAEDQTDAEGRYYSKAWCSLHKKTRQCTGKQTSIA